VKSALHTDWGLSVYLVLFLRWGAALDLWWLLFHSIHSAIRFQFFCVWNVIGGGQESKRMPRRRRKGCHHNKHGSVFFFVKKDSTPIRTVKSERLGWLLETRCDFGIILQVSVSKIYLCVFSIYMSILVAYLVWSCLPKFKNYFFKFI
jgi:hypothetical protein